MVLAITQSATEIDGETGKIHSGETSTFENPVHIFEKKSLTIMRE
jgi:hypothetical protein